MNWRIVGSIFVFATSHFGYSQTPDEDYFRNGIYFTPPANDWEKYHLQGKVKKVTSFEIDSSGNKYSSVDTSFQYSQEFNEHGFLTRQIQRVYDDSDSMRIQTYLYTQGKLNSILLQYDGDRGVVKYTYKDNELIEEYFIYKNDSLYLDQKMTVVFNQKHQVKSARVSTYTFEGVEKPEYTIDNIYDKKTNTIQVIYHYLPLFGDRVYNIHYQLDPLVLKPIKIVGSYQDTLQQVNVYKNEEFEYDDKGRLLKSIDHTNRPIKVIPYKYIYDNKGNPTLMTEKKKYGDKSNYYIYLYEYY